MQTATVGLASPDWLYDTGVNSPYNTHTCYGFCSRQPSLYRDHLQCSLKPLGQRPIYTILDRATVLISNPPTYYRSEQVSQNM